MAITNNYQFPGRTVLVQPNTQGAGAFQFDLSPQIPDADTIISVTVKTYDTKNVDTTSVLIDGTPTVVDSIVSVMLNYPGNAFLGKHKITFIYSTNAGMVDEADFCCVDVKDV